MRAADGDGKCVRCIGGNLASARQQAADHESDLILVRPARADDGELNLAGGEFVHLEPGARERRHRSAAGLAQQQGRFRIDVDEGFLDRGQIWRVRFDDLAQVRGEAGEALGEIQCRVWLDDAVGHPAEARAIDRDDAPAGVAQAGIDAEDSNHLVHLRKLADIERNENTAEVNRAETNAAELAGMRFSTPLMTRRAALRLGLAGASAALVAPAAFAGPAVSFPMRIACVRVSPEGFVPIRSAEQDAWRQMALRLGGLVDTLTPLQPTNMLGGGLPKIEGVASCALVARQMAMSAGFAQVILYATTDGQCRRET